MDKLTAIKIKYDDGTYSDEIPVSVLSENVEWDSTHTLVDVLGSIDVDVTGTIQDQISQLFNEKVSNSDMQNYITSSMPSYITTWLNTNVNPVGSAVIVDSSLTVSGAAADAKISGNEINSLKASLTGIITGNEFDFPINTEWSQGGVNQTGEYSSWSRIRTNYIDVSILSHITFYTDNGYAFLVVFYDNDFTVISNTSWELSEKEFLLDSNIKYLRVCLRKEPESNLSPSSGIYLHAKSKYSFSEDMKEPSQAIKTMKSLDISSFLIWTKGGIANGTDYNSNVRIRTDYFNIENYSLITFSCPTDYKYAITFYNANKEYLFTSPSSGFIKEKHQTEIDEKIKFIRIMFSKDPDENLADTSISENLVCKMDLKLVGEVKKNNNDLNNNLIENINWIRGTLDDNGNYIESTSRVVSQDYIQVSTLSSIKILSLTNNTLKYSVTFYGIEGKIASTPLIYNTSIVSLPANTISIKIVIINEPDAWLADASISKSIRVYPDKILNNNNGNLIIKDYFVETCVNKIEIPQLTTGTTILAIGDSITAAQDETGWVYHIAQMTGVTVIDKAIGGSTYGESVSDQTHRISNQIATVTNEEWSTSNLVIVAAGTNDYQHETPLDELKEKVQSAITAIKAKTNAPIVFITPIRRGLSSQDIILKIAMISGIISNVALANQCNVICGYNFPIPTYNINGLIDNMTRDSLHPTATGANVYARSVINALL